MKTPPQRCHSKKGVLVKASLVSAGSLMFAADRVCAQSAIAPVAPPAAANAAAAASASVAQVVRQLAPGLDLITVFGFVAGCVMVIGGFLNARRDENWKMTVIHGLSVAGTVALLKALFGLFSGPNSVSSLIGSF